MAGGEPVSRVLSPNAVASGGWSSISSSPCGEAPAAYLPNTPSETGFEWMALAQASVGTFGLAPRRDCRVSPSAEELWRRLVSVALILLVT